MATGRVQAPSRACDKTRCVALRGAAWRGRAVPFGAARCRPDYYHVLSVRAFSIRRSFPCVWPIRKHIFRGRMCERRGAVGRGGGKQGEGGDWPEILPRKVFAAPGSAGQRRPADVLKPNVPWRAGETRQAAPSRKPVAAAVLAARGGRGPWPCRAQADRHRQLIDVHSKFWPRFPGPVRPARHRPHTERARRTTEQKTIAIL